MIDLTMKDIHGDNYMVIPSEFGGLLCNVIGCKTTLDSSYWAHVLSNRAIGDDITMLMDALEGVVEFKPDGPRPNAGSCWILKATIGYFKKLDGKLVYWLPRHLQKGRING